MTKFLRRLTWLQNKIFLKKSKSIITLAVNAQNYSTGEGKTVDPKEVEFFGKEANNWWKETNVLLAMNQTRVPFIRDALKNHDTTQHTVRSKQLEGVSILDVGCGGGILSEALARLGAKVTGIDAARGMIEAAKQHASLDPSLDERLCYLNTTTSDLIQTEVESFDGVVASEVVEHVSDVDDFLGDCVRLVKPGGSIFITTINKTWAAYGVTIALAEWLGPIPKGTHQYQKFITPERVTKILHKNNCETKSVRGQMYNILTNKWTWIDTTAISYALHAVKC